MLRRCWKQSKKVFFSMCLLIILLCTNQNIYAQNQIIDSNNIDIEENETKVTTTVWKYKKINGKVYRRLYDTKNKKWLTDWILVK